MGSACCIAARDRTTTLPAATGGGALPRNVTCSPSWSFRWDNHRRVADEVGDSPYLVSRGESRNMSMEFKASLGSERGTLSEGGSPLGNLVTSTSQKSPPHEEMDKNIIVSPLSERSIASFGSTEVKSLSELPDMTYSSGQKLSFSVSSALSTPATDRSSTHVCPLPPSSTPSRRARHSPGHQLFRQVSDNQILGLKSSPNNYSISEGRSSFVLSTCSNDLTNGSHGGSSDGWSMRTFCELVASSQRERWSFDSEHLGSSRGKICGSSSRFSNSPSEDIQTCGVCLKLLVERSTWRNYRNCEIPVVSVLVCGHVYHAECLESMIPEADKYDPACPVCMFGEKRVSKMSGKALKSEAEIKGKLYKISRNRVVDSYLDGGCDDFSIRSNSKREGKASKMEPSSSARSSSSSKTFLRRHFSMGSNWGRLVSDNDSTRKKGFWAKYRKA